ncbi:GGDEF domain-containing response regulator [Chitinimonas lacunae]|uniref:diguanylate cyclase n=1 Tax=Chitinimonas lacunae TaxID=1963018 RepID=A0ABV8MM57_9NEIS
MSCSSVELQQKCTALTATWDGYCSTPTFENFVEFAVTLNSFAEFLIARGLSGLHHLGRDLEQVALALFGDERSHPIKPETMAELDQKLKGLVERVSDYIAANSRPREERRISTSPLAAPSDLQPVRQLWLVSQNEESWRDLIAQLGYFGIEVDIFRWDAVPAESPSVPLLLLDVAGLLTSEWSARIRTLRARFDASNLLALTVQTDFLSLQTALAAGCDYCFPRGTSLPTIVAKVLELNDSEEQEEYRVLVVEDSITAIKLIQRTLEENGIQSSAVSNPREVLDALKRYNPDLILMDMHMPNCTGVEAARVIRQHPQFLSIPIVYLSGETDVGMQIDALRLGGDHFLTKPVNPVWLNAIVKTKIERYRALRRSMFHDSLTGLLNHTSTKRVLDQAVSAAASDNGVLSVAMIDIDHFKKVNDTYGHPVGDQIIRSLAWLLKQRLRKTDIVGRYGGEEFLVGLPGTAADHAFEVLDRIRRDFSQIKHPFNETWFNTTFSSGIASFPAIESSEGLVKFADEALYQAKRGGRNRVMLPKRNH